MRRSRLMKKSLYIAIIISGLLFLTGCFDSEPQSSLKISLNSFNLENVKLERIVDSENIFRSYLNKYSLIEVNYVRFGDAIELEFEGDSPDFLFITDSIIDANGKYLYDELSDMKVIYSQESASRYFWTVGEHFANFKDPEIDSGLRIYRGIKIDAFFGEKKNTYVFVIQTENQEN
jgi:hypothetical protein